jgi:hypothetical protein
MSRNRVDTTISRLAKALLDEAGGERVDYALMFGVLALLAIAVLGLFASNG